MANKYVKKVLLNLDIETYLRLKAKAERAKLPVGTYIRTQIAKMMEGN